jgi:DNA gyrase/topoisomerase IV subunit B
LIVKNTPPKLQDCLQHGPESGAELFIVEGDSASSSVIQLCNPKLQAVLPMQGKPLNAIKASAAKVASNPLFSALVVALGAGAESGFDAAKLRYQRVVLLMDPDADGIHCGALMLMFFLRFMPALLAGGHVYMVRPPVGEVMDTATGEVQYGFIESEFVALCAAGRAAKPSHFNAQRYRGLAGISPSQLAHFCVNPNTRRSTVMRIEDAQMAIAVLGGAAA